MRAAADLTLPTLPIQADAFAEDPFPYLKAARRQHPWLANTDAGFFFVHEYEAIKELSMLDDKLRPSMDGITEFMGGQGGAWANHFANTMLAKQPPDHTRIRAAIAPSFTPQNINRFRPLMRQAVSDLLDEWEAKGEFDFARFAACFPIRIMFALIGASPKHLPSILAALETMGLSANLMRELLPDLNKAVECLWDFVHKIIVERQTNGGGEANDVLNSLIAAHTSGQLNERELHDLLIFLFSAGYDTSKNMLTFIMYEMVQRPEYWARCAEDKTFCNKVIEETFRYHSVASLYRTATEDVIFRDVLFPKGTIIFMALMIASRDPAAFPDADVFNPERSDAVRHVAFGRGIHMCLGQHMARAQIQEGMHVIAQRLKNMRLAGKITWRPFPGVWGIRSLPIAFGRQAAK